ncbi:DUF5957 family protein [Nocardiopsis trehalosi]|jgi:uncharacterized membrane protein YeaQ/YmgE (transglycosylase-associated protein family)|uniref:DUF5957 family protein n=1 Tax=Nocardiopsis trehalosi TaxID=109329 RepID=UPI00082F34E7|nr:DUF5957 family protein [Nocardiopsis trehalosi]
MRIALTVVLGVIGGFLAGFVIAEVIGIASLLALGEPVGIPYLSIGAAVVGAVVAPLVYRRVRRSRRVE